MPRLRSLLRGSRRAISYVTAVALILGISIVAIAWVYMTIQPYAEIGTTNIEIARSTGLIKEVAEKCVSLVTQGPGTKSSARVYIRKGHVALSQELDEISLNVNGSTILNTPGGSVQLSQLHIVTKTSLQILAGSRVIEGGELHYLTPESGGERTWYQIVEKQDPGSDEYHLILRFKAFVQVIVYTDEATGSRSIDVVVIFVNFTSTRQVLGGPGLFHLYIENDGCVQVGTFSDSPTVNTTYVISISGHDSIFDRDFEEEVMSLRVGAGDTINVRAYLVTLKLST